MRVVVCNHGPYSGGETCVDNPVPQGQRPYHIRINTRWQDSRLGSPERAMWFADYTSFRWQLKSPCYSSYVKIVSISLNWEHRINIALTDPTHQIKLFGSGDIMWLSKLITFYFRSSIEEFLNMLACSTLKLIRVMYNIYIIFQIFGIAMAVWKWIKCLTNICEYELYKNRKDVVYLLWI